ncbi:MAG: hypothetical protein ACJ77K_05215 [Bacteroidia bacterium]
MAMIYRVDITDVPNTQRHDSFFILLFIPAVLLGFLIIYNMSLFNSDKSQGIRFRYQEVLLFLITFFSFCLPLLIIFPASFILNVRTAGLETDEQLRRDEVVFNEATPFFPLSEYDYHYFPSDSVYLLNSSSYPDNYESSHREFWELMRDSIFWHRGAFKDKRPYLYYTRLQQFNRNSSYDDVLTDQDSMYLDYLKKVNLKRDPVVAMKHISDMSNLLNKYSPGITLNTQDILRGYMQHEYLTLMDHSTLEQIVDCATSNIYAIDNAKNRVSLMWKVDVKAVIALFIFCFTIAFRIFKNVHWKQLLIAAAVIIGGTTIMAIFEDTFRTRGNIFANIGMFLPLLLIILSLKGFSVRSFNWMLCQTNILLSFFLPFYPLIVLYFLRKYFDIFEIPYFDRYKELIIEPSGYQRWVYNSEYFRLIKLIWQLTLWTGILSYVFVWQSYLKALFLRYWALPKNK